jgi:hypothetical protein
MEESMVEYKGFTIGITSVAIVAALCSAGVGHANAPAERLLAAKDGGATVNSFELAGKDGGIVELKAKDGGIVELAAKDGGKSVELSARETADFLTAAKDGGGWELAAKDGGKTTPSP